MVPRPRAPRGLDRSPLAADRGHPVRARRATPLEAVRTPPDTRTTPAARPAGGPAPVALTRTPQGWAVTTSCSSQPVADLVEGLTLADLVVEELGGIPELDRTARRSARGPVPGLESPDPRDDRIAALERTVAQLEHALAARVATERALGMLAERYGISPRAAFEALRAEARSHGRPVQELAREVLDGRSVPGFGPSPAGTASAGPARPVAPVPRPPATTWGACAPAADGRP